MRMTNMKKIIGSKESFGVLFRAPQERGAMEWRLFDVITGDTVDIHKVEVPHKALTARGEHNKLYIAYPSEILRTAH